MSLKFDREIEDITSILELKEAIADLPDDMPVSDALGEPLLLRFYVDEDTDDPCVEVG
jgi:hypothetical protein